MLSLPSDLQQNLHFEPQQADGADPPLPPPKALPAWSGNGSRGRKQKPVMKNYRLCCFPSCLQRTFMLSPGPGSHEWLNAPALPSFFCQQGRAHHLHLQSCARRLTSCRPLDSVHGRCFHRAGICRLSMQCGESAFQEGRAEEH